MNVLRLCALSVLFGIAAASVFAQQAPSYPRGSTASIDRQAPQLTGKCDTDALLAENTRLTKQVELLKKNVELLEARIRILRGSK